MALFRPVSGSTQPVLVRSSKPYSVTKIVVLNRNEEFWNKSSFFRTHIDFNTVHTWTYLNVTAP